MYRRAPVPIRRLQRRRLVRVQIIRWKVHFQVIMDEEDCGSSTGKILYSHTFLSRVAAEGWIEKMRHQHFPVKTHKLVESGTINGPYFYSEQSA
jgi:hypothetical protein